MHRQAGVPGKVQNEARGPGGKAWEGGQARGALHFTPFLVFLCVHVTEFLGLL